ncbi:uncharacterized protein LOC133036883 [Cannabis sativa]|uniref:uncharacterized protein LOC133036883 n=1 Tax=Cannabis sativa TaxID=3483 RepID=UPI0029CA7D8D|nr:uncharacterized protein LOC133036883 [Cannabis sativa]
MQRECWLLIIGSFLMDSLNLLGWNVRGLNNVEKQREVFDLCKINKVGFGALFETKIHHDRVSKLMENNPNWKIYSSQETSFRILLIWIEKLVNVDILLIDRQLIHCKLKMVGYKEEFFLTAVYGSNSLNERKDLWNKLTNIGHLNAPWIILGDFNAMFAYKDRSGGRKVRSSEIQDSQNWLAWGQVEELKTAGSFFTWSNNHEEGSRVYSKLDRVLTNESWFDKFPNTEASFRWGALSDHSYCLIKHIKTGIRGTKPFRFSNHWMFKEGYRETVLSSWKKHKVTDLSTLHQQLFRVKHILKTNYVKKSEDVTGLYNEARDKFIAAQEALAINHLCPTAITTEKVNHANYLAARKQYFSYLHQHSKACWLKLGDENTSYFHAIMKKRRAENKVCSFTANGVVVDEYDKVVEHFLNHFRNFMGRQSSVSRRMDEDCLEFGQKLTLEHQEVSATTISLIPKIDNPQGATDYRPIACCTTTYKCISKMIYTRLSEVLPVLIHENQGAFVKKRLLAHNVLILQDLLKGYTRKTISSRCLRKIDLSKAYDTVDWCFVADILKALCFPSKFITWILSCLQGASYALLLNGRIQGSFKGEKGLRQGDLMSPLLFVIIMEYLTRLLIQCSKKKGFGFHPLCESLGLVNLCFADDLIIFYKGNDKSVQMVKNAFNPFSEATGLVANKAKSTVFFGGIPNASKQRLANILQMEEGSFPLKNLSFAGRAQLIHSILLGIRNYWMGLFLLPQKITAAIDKCCRDFLWGSVGNRSKLHIPSWEKVCLPKNARGLGFREGKAWNIALMAKYIWAISSKQDNLWVRWIDAIYLRGLSFWTVEFKQDESWYFKKFLRLCSTVNETMVTAAIKRGKFSAKLFYLSFIQAQKIDYARNIWNRMIVPKHRFIGWQIVNNQLLTRDNLSRFMPISSPLCPVYCRENELHQHLFVTCCFTRNMVDEITKWFGQFDWPIDFSSWFSKAAINLQGRITNAVILATLYMIFFLFRTIGKPAMIDKVTQERSMVKFAYALVEIEISYEPPKTISFNIESKTVGRAVS